MATKSAIVNENQATYWRYLDLIAKAKASEGFPFLPSELEMMLDIIASASARGAPLRVLEAMVANRDISTTTAHRMIKRLRNDAWIVLRTNLDDERIKFTEPSAQALRYFALHSKCMIKALKGTAA